MFKVGDVIKSDMGESMNVGQVVHYIGDIRAKKLSKTLKMESWYPLEFDHEVYGIVTYIKPHQYNAAFLMIYCRITSMHHDADSEIIEHELLDFYEFELEIVE